MTAPAEATQHGALVLVILKSEARVDSREMAKNLGNKHQSVLELITNYKCDYEEMGILRFETEVKKGRGQPEKYALLNEDQCYLLLTYSRNSARVRQLKVRLVKAFRDARRAVDIRKTEYLPEYHALHDEVARLAADSPNERHVHVNVNRLLNKFAGLDSEQRAMATLPQQAMLIVGQSMAARAAKGATDHHDGYQRIKAALHALRAITALEPLQ